MTGRTRSTAASSPPAMTVSWPFSAPAWPPDTGASTNQRPAALACSAASRASLAEGLHFARHAGLDLELVIAAIAKGAAQSWQMENRWKTMSEDKYDFGFAVDWMRKDLGLTLDEARRNGSSLQLTALVDQFYAEIQQMGGSRWDTSSLLARLD